jgi:hypothetical protein
MYKILVALLISCVSGSVFAGCPAKLIGKYSGQATYTEVNGGIVDEVAEKLIVISFDGKGTAIISRYVEVDTGIVGVDIQTTPKSIHYTFDKSSCSVSMPDNVDGDINLVVADSGKTVYGVKREITFNSVERYLLTKQ